MEGLVQQVRSRFYDDIRKLHGTMPLLVVSHSVDLGELFVDVNILEVISSDRRLEIDDLWQDFTDGVQKYCSYRSFDRIALGNQQQRVSGLEVLDKNTNLMVLGKPGSGKTTYLQRIVTECNQGNLQPHRIPILIKLRDFVKDDDARKFEFNLKPYLTQQWQLNKTETELILNQGRASILLDGLDEVSGTDGQTISEKIKQFVRNYPHNQLIVTCRTNRIEDDFNWKSLHFDFVEVADFNEQQVNTFAEHYFNAINSHKQEGEKKTKEFLKNFYLEENKNIRELAITPILLSLTCAVFNERDKFYSKRSKLYEEGLELLLEQWDDSKGIKRDEIYKYLSPEREQELLSYLAVKKFEQPQYVLFEQEEIEGYIAEFLDITRRDSRVVLKAIETQHGLLIERAQKVWSFSHLTFQEYLTAKYIVSNKRNVESISQYVNPHITSTHWREIFILIVQMLRNSDDLLKFLKKETDNMMAADTDLQHILTWLVQMHNNVIGGYNLTAIRAAYMDIILSINYQYYSQNNSGGNRIIYSYLAVSIISRKIYISESLADVIYENTLPRSLYRNQFLANFLVCLLDFNRVPTMGNLQGVKKYINEFLDAYNSRNQLTEIIQQFKGIIEGLESVSSDLESTLQNVQKWWQKNGKTWINKIRENMIIYRNIGHDWQLSQTQEKQLGNYYTANQLLIDCLNSGCTVSDEVRHEIEDTLLLPIAEIEKRKRETSK